MMRVRRLLNQSLKRFLRIQATGPALTTSGGAEEKAFGSAVVMG
jgi:hypothetical protein